MSEPRPRLHWLMYGLYYPAILGTAIVFTLQHLATGSVERPALCAALTAGAFFSLSFSASFKSEDEYWLVPFLLDTFEIGEMILCFILLDLAEPIPSFFKPVPRVREAYLVLVVAVVVQFLWRAMMGLKWNAFIDLKLTLLGLLLLGAFANSTQWVDWTVPIGFTLIASAYVANHPYAKHDKARTWFVIRS